MKPNAEAFPVVVELAETSSQVAACFPAMRELRPHLTAETFVDRVERQRKAGYFLLAARSGATVVSVAGCRLGENLSRGLHLYVDDFVTLAAFREQGCGGRLWDRIIDLARKAGAAAVHLDSGLQRQEAHSFYEHRGMTFGARHYSLKL
jgi:GNAT superfamily N-acetyltransferase